jgi:hypothetical protein
MIRGLRGGRVRGLGTGLAATNGRAGERKAGMTGWP